MRKLILTSLILLFLLIGAVSANDMDNSTDIETELISSSGDVSEIEINNENVNNTLLQHQQSNLESLSSDDQIVLSDDGNVEQNSQSLLKSGNDDILRASVIYISPTGTGSGATPDDPTSFDNAVDNIDSDGIIYFLDGEYFINKLISANKNIVFQAVNAGSAIINANRQNYAIRINNANTVTTVIGLTFINSANNPALYVSGDLTVINSTFRDNNGGSDGGAISGGRTITVKDSTFINNSAANMGGAIYGYSLRYIVNVSNSVFENNTANTAGAIYSRNNLVVNSSKFKNNTARTGMGGALYAFYNADVDDSEFIQNTASGSGGAIRADSVTVSNSLLNNNTSLNGGGSAIYTSKNVTAINSKFINNQGKTSGAVTTSYSGPTYIDECEFINNTAGNSGAAINGGTNYVNNTIFINNNAGNYGGAVYSHADSILKNCTFKDNNASRGGAIYSNNGINIDGSVFEDNSAESYGGALCANTEISVNDSKFNGNSAENGGAIYGRDVKVNKSDFTKNTASDFGGAIYGWGGDIELDNSKFIQNFAVTGGGAVIAYNVKASGSEFSENEVDLYGGAIYALGCDISDSNFTKNHAAYSGGAIFSDDASISGTNFIENNATNGGAFITANAQVDSSNFIGNTAFDGAAIDCDNLTVNNSYFKDNAAKSYGVIYTVDGNIKNSQFEDNSALNDLQIYALNSLNLENVAISPNESLLENTTKDHIKNITDDYIIELDSGLIGYCTQRTIYWTNGDVYVMDSLDLLRNQITGEYIGEYLKILLYHFYNNRTDLFRTIWEFTDADFRNSDNEYVKEVLRLYDSGFRVPTKGATLILDNNTQILIDFYSAGKSSTQNLFLYNVTYFGDNYNLSIEKISLNVTVKLGENSYFDIVVKNTGDTILHNIRVVEESYDDLTYISWLGINGNWNHVLESNKHVFVLDELYPNHTAMFRVIFKTTSTGVKTNVVVASSNETNKTNSSNKTTVYHPGMKIEKITLTPVVKVGEITRFEIVVSNTGDIALHDVSVIEYNFDGLIYKGFTSKNGVWRHEIRNNKHVFILTKPLGVNESASFTISFLTTKVGSFTNTVIGTSNETEPVSGKNVTNVTSSPEPLKNKTNKDKKIPAKSRLNELKTGNPFAILLLTSIILVLNQVIRRKK